VRLVPAIVQDVDDDGNGGEDDAGNGQTWGAEAGRQRNENVTRHCHL
jgi:hypothetical protein